MIIGFLKWLRVLFVWFLPESLLLHGIMYPRKKRRFSKAYLDSLELEERG